MLYNKHLLSPFTLCARSNVVTKFRDSLPVKQVRYHFELLLCHGNVLRVNRLLRLHTTTTKERHVVQVKETACFHHPPSNAFATENFQSQDWGQAESSHRQLL